MDPEFWQERWARNQTAFHAAEANDLLLAHFEQISVPEPSRVLIPLCGKTHDIDWLASRGHAVVGCELNRSAVEEVFDRMDLTPEEIQDNDLVRLVAGPVEIFVGDFFHMTADQLGPVDAIYDRAALVALPEAMRRDYAEHLSDISGTAPQLLVSFDYDQTMMDGPPFSVPAEAIEALYGHRYQLRLLSRRPIGGTLAQRCTGHEEAWLLSAK